MTASAPSEGRVVVDDGRAENIEMTNRQLAAAVRFGRLVTFETPELSEKEVTGYIMGWDDINIRMSVCEFDDEGDYIRNKLIGRDFIAGIEIARESTLSKEPLKGELEGMVKKFRTRIVHQYFPDARSR